MKMIKIHYPIASFPGFCHGTTLVPSSARLLLLCSSDLRPRDISVLSRDPEIATKTSEEHRDRGRHTGSG